jgi:hypothetical protein
MPSPLDFHTHHAAFGAYGSFSLGHLRAGGGMNIHDGRAPHQGGVHVGYGRASEGLTLLPFSIPSPVDLSAFTSEEGKPSQQPAFQVVPDDLLSRKLEWSTDTWIAPGFSLRIATPFGTVPDPRSQGWEALREHILPAIWVELELDNRSSDEEAIVLFGMAPGDTGAAELNHAKLVGATCQGRFGLATERDHMARPYAGFSGPSCFDSQLGLRAPHWLGGTWGVCWTVPARQQATLRVALGWYHAGQATSGLSTTYAYTRLWSDIESVLAEAIAQQDAAWKTARERDQELSNLSPARKFLLAHATRGYFGNSQLLADCAGDPVYVVNEGEYCMINTLDLSVDQGFFEARFFPWATREILDLAARRHSFLDHLKTPDDTTLHEGGVSFAHDMGVRNQFAAPGTSSYEHPNLEGCFSHMTFEQACNFALCAAQYSTASNDLPWVRRNTELLEQLLESLEAPRAPVGLAPSRHAYDRFRPLRNRHRDHHLRQPGPRPGPDPPEPLHHREALGLVPGPGKDPRLGRKPLGRSGARGCGAIGPRRGGVAGRGWHPSGHRRRPQWLRHFAGGGRPGLSTVVERPRIRVPDRSLREDDPAPGKTS